MPALASANKILKFLSPTWPSIESSVWLQMVTPQVCPHSVCAVGIPKYKQRRGANWYVLLKVLQLFDRYRVRNQTTSAIESRDLGHHASMEPNSSEEYTGIDETKGESGRQNGLLKNTWGLTVIFVVVTMAAEWIPDIPYDSPVSAQAWAGGS